ncbi:MAG: hypothetical protein ACK40A_19125, partial [Pannonibacter indicus]
MTSQKTIPSARSAVDPFLAMDVLSAARALEAEGRHLIHMEVGQPGAPAPSTVLAAARQAIEPLGHEVAPAAFLEQAA